MRISGWLLLPTPMPMPLLLLRTCCRLRRHHCCCCRRVADAADAAVADAAAADDAVADAAAADDAVADAAAAADADGVAAISDLNKKNKAEMRISAWLLCSATILGDQQHHRTLSGVTPNSS